LFVLFFSPLPLLLRCALFVRLCSADVHSAYTLIVAFYREFAAMEAKILVRGE